MILTTGFRSIRTGGLGILGCEVRFRPHHRWASQYLRDRIPQYPLGISRYEGIQGFVTALREGALKGDVSRSQITIGGDRDKVIGAKLPRIDLVLDERFAGEAQNPDIVIEVQAADRYGGLAPNEPPRSKLRGIES